MYLLNNTQQQDNRMLNILKEMVSASGAVFMGLQYDLLDALDGELWFTNPKTGDPLSITIIPTHFTFDDIDLRIRAALTKNDCDHNNRRVSIHAKKLREFSERLSKLSEEIAAFYEEKR